VLNSLTSDDKLFMPSYLEKSGNCFPIILMYVGIDVYTSR